MLGAFDAPRARRLCCIITKHADVEQIKSHTAHACTLTKGHFSSPTPHHVKTLFGPLLDIKKDAMFFEHLSRSRNCKLDVKCSLLNRLTVKGLSFHKFFTQKILTFAFRALILKLRAWCRGYYRNKCGGKRARETALLYCCECVCFRGVWRVWWPPLIYMKAFRQSFLQRPCALRRTKRCFCL